MLDFQSASMAADRGQQRAYIKLSTSVSGAIMNSVGVGSRWSDTRNPSMNPHTTQKSARHASNFSTAASVVSVPEHTSFRAIGEAG